VTTIAYRSGIIAADSRETWETDGGRHLAKAAWRILAALQLDIEAERGESA
jgi:hypothetical protein